MDGDTEKQSLIENAKPDQSPEMDCCKACKVFWDNFLTFFFHSAQFSIDIFWAMIMILTTPFIKVQLNATSTVATILWMGGPIAGLVIGTFVGGLVMNLGGNLPSTKRYFLSWVMVVSLVVVIGLSLGFARLAFMDVSSDASAQTAQGIATFIFFLLMIAINFYMPSYWNLKALFSSATISKFAPPIWSAIAYVVALSIVTYLPISPGDPSKMFYLFGIAGGLMVFFTGICLISLWCVNIQAEEEKALAKIQQDEKYDKEDDVEAPQGSCCDIGEICCKPFEASFDLWKEGGWLTCMIVFFSWAALYSFMPVATDWYANDLLHEGDKDPGYEGAIAQAAQFLVAQQGAQGICAGLLCILNLALDATLLKEDKDRFQGLGKDHEFYHFKHYMGNFYFQVIIYVVCLGSLTVGLLFMSFSEDPGWFPLLGCILFGLGPVAIYPLREFQRAFLRVQRYRKDGTELEDSKLTIQYKRKNYYRHYFARDSAYDVVINNFLVLGQLYTFALFSKFSDDTGYPVLFRYVGSTASSFAILLALLTLCPCSMSCFDERKGSTICCSRKKPPKSSFQVSAKPGQLYPMDAMKTRSRIVFRVQRKRHQL
jgi:MFS family permease